MAPYAVTVAGTALLTCVNHNTLLQFWPKTQKEPRKEVGSTRLAGHPIGFESKKPLNYIAVSKPNELFCPILAEYHWFVITEMS